jgi:hypothetical protein
LMMILWSSNWDIVYCIESTSLKKQRESRRQVTSDRLSNLIWCFSLPLSSFQRKREDREGVCVYCERLLLKSRKTLECNEARVYPQSSIRVWKHRKGCEGVLWSKHRQPMDFMPGLLSFREKERERERWKESLSLSLRSSLFSTLFLVFFSIGWWWCPRMRKKRENGQKERKEKTIL